MHERQPAQSLQHLSPGARGGGGGGKEGRGVGKEGGGRGGGGEGGEGGGEGGGGRQVLTESARGPRPSRIISNLLEEQQRQLEAKNVSGDASSEAVEAVREGRAGGAGLGLCERFAELHAVFVFVCLCVCVCVCVCARACVKYLHINIYIYTI